jgi:hypothetical protein
MLAGGDRAQRAFAPPAGRRDIEVDVDRPVRERRGRIRRPGEPAMRGGESRELVRIAPEQHGLGNEAVAVAQWQPAFLADRQDRADQVLVGAEASGDAVHRDAKRSGRHDTLLMFRRDGAARHGAASPCACRA